MIHRNVTTAVVLTAVVSVWGYWLFGRPGRKTTRPVSTADLAALHDSQAPADFRLVHGSGLTVKHEDGSPAADAELWADPAHARAVRPESATRLAKADDQGRIAWPTITLDADSHLVLRVPGHRSATVPSGMVGRGLTVSTRRGHTLTVHCRDVDGKPLAGATVSISCAGWSQVFGPHDQVMPGGDPYGALHVAHTDAQGRARISELAAARYALTIEHPTHVICGVSGVAVTVPREDLTVEMIEPIGGVLTPPPGDHVDMLTITSDTRAVTRQFSATGLERIRNRFRADHPGAGVVALPPRSSDGPMVVQGTLLLRQRGWQPFELTLAPISKVTPTALTTSAPPRTMAHLRLHTNQLAHARGWRPNGLRLRHLDTGLVCTFDLPLDQTLNLPGGNYFVDSLDPLVASMLPKAPLALHDGSLMEVPLQLMSGYLVRVSVRGPDGQGVGPCRIEYGPVGGATSHVESSSSLDQALRLSDGPVELRVVANGYEVGRRRLNMPHDARDGSLLMRLDYAR